MTTAYREGALELRRELLEEREVLLAEPLASCEPACRAELEVLRRRLESAEDDPLDHVREGLRLYGMTLEAGRSAGAQRRLKWRRTWLVVAIALGSVIALVGGRIGYQYATYDFLVNPCPGGVEDGKRHFVTRHDGMLGVDFGCEALSDEDCRIPCLREGRCSAEEGRCVARSEADCRQSLVCGYHGECARQGDRCVVGDAEDCRVSEGCRQDGSCSLKGSRCAPMSDADCRSSVRCAEDGLCRLGFEMCEPKYDPSADDCARIGHCIAAGLCTRLDLPEGCPGSGREMAAVTTRGGIEPSTEGAPATASGR